MKSTNGSTVCPTKEDAEEMVSTNDKENGKLIGHGLFDDVCDGLLGNRSNDKVTAKAVTRDIATSNAGDEFTASWTTLRPSSTSLITATKKWSASFII